MQEAGEPLSSCEFNRLLPEICKSACLEKGIKHLLYNAAFHLPQKSDD